MPKALNNPAGRLNAVLSELDDDNSQHSVAAWWAALAERCAPDVDKYAFRAEVASLLRDVDRAIELLDVDEQDNFLRQRPAWSTAVFGWGLNEGVKPDGQRFVHHWSGVSDPEARRWLQVLSSLLSRDAPEFELIGTGDELDANLQRILSTIDEITELLYARDSDLPAALRVSLVRLVLDLRDDVHYVGLRGWRRLHNAAAATESAFEASLTANRPPHPFAGSRPYDRALACCGTSSLRLSR